MRQKVVVEIAVFSIEAAVLALKAGADRIEFCENPTEGGTTPSYGSLCTLIALTDKPVFPIIRPRGGDFLYTNNEYECIKKDLLMVKSLGYPGAVIGLLQSDGSIDIKRTTELVQLAAPMEITFHRAFDRCNDPFKALDEIINTGCKRILTSGQVPNVENGIPMIQKLIQLASDRIIILPGSGVRSHNCKHIIDETGAKEIHSAARIDFASNMNFQVKSMQERLSSISVNEKEVEAILLALGNKA